jgi:hypothetical protein
MINSMANHLRYPNNLTLFFSKALLQLFVQFENFDMIKEQITR